MRTIKKGGIDRGLYRLLGFTIPVPFFLAPSAGFLPTLGYVDDAPLSFPLSLFFLPAALLWPLLRGNLKRSKSLELIALVFFLMAAWALSLGLFRLAASPEAVLFGLQWALPLPWLLAMMGARSSEALQALMKGFVVGTFAAVAYICVIGLAEVAIYGGLLDGGRVTQNLVLPGQYQLYVYTPTVLAFSLVLTYASLRFTNLFNVSAIWRTALLVFGAVGLVFLGAREGLLVFCLGMFAVALAGRVVPMILAASSVVAASAIFLAREDLILGYLRNSDLRISGKLVQVLSGERALAGRDEMVWHYIDIFLHSPLVGTMMEQPAFAPSAHNYYVDAFAWGGAVLGGLALAMLLLALVVSGGRLIQGIGSSEDSIKFTWVVAALLVTFLLVSNNVNVPLRQPLTVPIFSILLILCAGGSGAALETQRPDPRLRCSGG